MTAETLSQQPPIRLFDRLPDRLRGRESEIKSKYDATIGHFGIVVVLDGRTGIPLRARLTDLLDGNNVLNYVNLQRSKWASPKGPEHDVERGTRLFEKLQAAEDYVRDSWNVWKTENTNRLPQREYINTHRNMNATSEESVPVTSRPKVHRPEKASNKQVALDTHQEPVIVVFEPKTVQPKVKKTPEELSDEALKQALREIPLLRKILGVDEDGNPLL
jgi:hypothetical protein